MTAAPQNEIVSCSNCGLRIRRKKLDRHAEEFCPARAATGPTHPNAQKHVRHSSNQIVLPSKTLASSAGESSTASRRANEYPASTA
jgi:hypothetical protein